MFNWLKKNLAPGKLNVAVATAPSDSSGYKERGDTQVKAGQWEAAAQSYRQALEIDAQNIAARDALINIVMGQGRFPEAEAIFRGVLEKEPHDAVMHYNLGVVVKAQGRPAEAEASYREALGIKPDFAEALGNLGAIYREQGRLPEAETTYRRLLGIRADDVMAYYCLANIVREQDRAAEAEVNYRSALQINPHFAEAYLELGMTLVDQNKLDEGESSFRRALEIRPEFVEARYNQANTLKAQGRFSEAESCYRQALELKPDFAQAHNNLGVTLNDQGRYSEAETCFAQALAIMPDYIEAHIGMGSILQKQGRLAEAEECYRRLLEIKPDHIEAHISMGGTLQMQGRLVEAESCFRAALEIEPECADAHYNLGPILRMRGLSVEAYACYRRALELNPEFDIARTNLLFDLSSEAADARAPSDSQDESVCYLAEAWVYGNKVTARAKPYTTWQVRPLEQGQRKLRVGLVSGDFSMHPVGYFLESVVAHLDRERVELVAYSNKFQEDALTARLKRCFGGWRCIVGLNDEAAARLIHDDGIDILIDLSGHTSHNRLAVFAWKPAPVQASWLGYFASTGVPSIDYLLADPISVPEANRRHFTEKIWYLPDTRLCFTAPDSSDTLALTPPPALRQRYITFGCFQSTAKINDRVLAAWSKIFQALPQARLRLQSRQLNYPVIHEQMQQRLAQLGLSAERVTILGSTSRDAYLAAHAEVDIILDTFPYPGGTTTCEALWMGVPTVTIAGNSMLARQGASMLACAGLEEWIAGDEEDYVARTLAHAGDLERLAHLRSGLREQVLASPLFDAARFAANLEEALQGMARESSSLMEVQD